MLEAKFLADLEDETLLGMLARHIRRKLTYFL